MTPLARQAVRLYPRTSYTERKAVNTLRRGWIRQIQYLGDKWLLARPVPRKQSGHVGDIAVFAVTVIGSILVMML
jgi:hypothetical protein